MKEKFEDTKQSENGETIIRATTSPNGMPCIDIRDPSPELRKIIKKMMQASHIDDPEYHLRAGVSPFMQTDRDDQILIEFWLRDYQPFIDYINALLQSEQE